MAAAIYKNGISGDELALMGKEKWGRVIAAGIDFATEVCMSYENYISKEFAAGYRTA